MPAAGQSARDVRAGGAYVDVYAKDGVSGVLAKIKTQINDLAGHLKRTGLFTAAAGGAMGAGPLGFLMGGINRGARIAQMAEFSQAFRVPIQVMNKLQYAADQAGVSIGEVMNDTTGKFRQLIARAPAINPGDAEKALQIQQRFKDATLALQNAMLPLVQIITPLVEKFTAFVQANAQYLPVAATVAAALVGLGTSLVGVSVATTTVTTAFSLLKPLWIFIARFAVRPLIQGLLMLKTALVSVVTIGIGALVNGFMLATSYTGIFVAGLTAVVVLMRKDFVNILRTIGDVFHETWGGIVNAVKAGDLALAFRVAAAGIKVIWYELLRGLSHAFAGFIEDNRTAIVVLASLAAGIKAAKIGGRFGPAAGIASFVAAAGLTAFGTDALIDDAVGGLKHTPRLDGAIRATKEELDRLTKGAAAAAGPGIAMGGAEADKARMQAEFERRAMRPFEGIKGAFNLASAQQQFGYGDKAVQTELTRQIAQHTEEAAKGIGKLLLALRLR